MHLAGAASVAQRYREAKAAGHERHIQALGFALAGIGRGGLIIAGAVSEPGQDLTRPATTAVRTENGWRINGLKIFCTMSPAADAFYVAVTHLDDNGEERYAYALIPRSTPGLTVNDDWDALGMRASGSHSLTLKDVDVPESAVRGGWPAGSLQPGLLEANFAAGLFHASASVGIAESAHTSVLETVAKKRQAGVEAGPHTLITASQNAIDLFAMRAAFDRAAHLIDEFLAAVPPEERSLDALSRVYAEVQAAKTFVNEAAVRIVDRALTLSGGAGYMNKHPLSRAYRDVRAGGFMHPLGANRAYEFIGQVALGQAPVF
jgi:alkylation response protein AidB-like acyl-CoA dehydrogenase